MDLEEDMFRASVTNECSWYKAVQIANDKSRLLDVRMKATRGKGRLYYTYLSPTTATTDESIVSINV
jgi:hypothetical protein